MPPRTPEVLAELDRAHQEVSEWAGTLAAWKGVMEAPDLERLESFFRTRVREHFLYEETVLFPMVVAGDASLEPLIQRLRAEHLDILRDLHELFSAMAMEVLAARPRRPAVDERAEAIVGKLLLHARSEDEELLPRLRQAN